MNKEEIIGSFYEQEMVKYDSDVFEIEKVITKKKGKLLVKWKGYDSESWINEKDVMQV